MYLKVTMTLTLLPPPKSPFLKTLLFLCSTSLLLPDADAVQPIIPNPSSSSTTGTIPAFPEQAEAAGCPLNLSDDHYEAIKSACGSNKPDDDDLHRSRCCPVLAAWLYSAYSATALSASQGHTTSYDMPLLPDDSETCVSDLGKALKVRGIQLFQPNETCDVVYCYCGIRLHPLTCPESFSVTPSGSLVVNQSVKRLARDCSSSSTNVNKFPGLGGCSKCLHSLYSVTFLFSAFFLHILFWCSLLFSIVFLVFDGYGSCSFQYDQAERGFILIKSSIFMLGDLESYFLPSFTLGYWLVTADFLLGTLLYAPLDLCSSRTLTE